MKHRHPRKWFLVGAAAVYGVLVIGGYQASDLTTKCVRSHPDTVVTAQGDEYDTTVCDWKVLNGKDWNVLGPVRVVFHLG